MPTKKANLSTMDELLAQNPPKTLAVGDVVEAKVLSASRNEIWLDLGAQGAGLVARKEINPAVSVKVGDAVKVSVLDPESEWGFPILSLRKVAKEKGWDKAEKYFEERKIITVYPYDANRGGLLVEVDGTRGFLPVSQLTAEHYPRVDNADKDEILSRLNSLVKKPLQVRILDMDRDQNKLIVSEKEAVLETTKKKLSKIKVGDVLDGVVTGSVDFGVFVTVDGIEGLVHISELSWDRVNNPADLYKVGDKIKTKVIAVDEDKLSLSIKQLSEDPWLAEVEKLKPGQKVKGEVTRITPFGAFVQISPAVEALLHVSELTAEEAENMDKRLAVGQSHEFEILEIDNDTRKISLTTKNPAKPTKKKAK